MTHVPKWLIAASFMLNLALGGYLVGDIIRGHGAVQTEPADGRGALPIPRERLSADERGHIRRVLRSAFDSASGERSARRQAERSFIAALSAEPFDEDAARARLAALRRADAALRDHISARILDDLGSMSPAQRAEIGRILARYPDRRRGRADAPPRAPISLPADAGSPDPR